MKTRNGFVSNSSSSSFVVAFDKVPESAEELQKILFGKDSSVISPWSYPGAPSSITTEQVAKTVFQDIQGQEPADRGRIIKKLDDSYGWYDEDDDDSICKNCGHVNGVEEEDAEVDPFLKKNEGKIFFLFSYADEDGDYYSILEHGGIFEKLPHLIRSHH